MFKFDFAISYAGEEVGVAKDLFQLLRNKRAKVFFAKNEKVYLLGKSLKSELSNIFGPSTRFVIPIISKHYVQKDWTKFEFCISKMEKRKRDYEFILPIRLDNVTLEGLEGDTFYIDLIKEGFLETAEIIMRKLREIYPAKEVTVPKVWVATFGLIIDDLLENYELPHSVPSDYPHLCDWLERDLMNHLSKTSIGALKLLEDTRDGETLSVRVGFKLDPDKHPFDFGDIGWWEFLELDEFNRIYPDQDWKEIFGG